MGCAASSAKTTPLDTKPAPIRIGGRWYFSHTLLQQPVVGGTSADVVEGAPVTPKTKAFNAYKKCGESAPKPSMVDDTDIDPQATSAELGRKATIVQGLADASISIAKSNLIAAAGLARAAASVAEHMAEGSRVETGVSADACELASTALAAAERGDATYAASLIEAVALAAVHVAKGQLEIKTVVEPEAEAPSPIKQVRFKPRSKPMALDYLKAYDGYLSHKVDKEQPRSRR